MTEEVTYKEHSASRWTASQVAIMAVLCLGVGMLIGYLLHSPVTLHAALPSASTPHPAAGSPQAMPTLAQLNHMADKQAEPLLQQLQSDPKNVELLMRIAYVYKAAHLFKESASYFDRALQVAPNNVTAHTEMASCLYYTGDSDAAIAQLEQSLKYDPKHAGTLFNLGMIRWKGKSDTAGAVAAWEKLLRLNPNYERRAAVEKLIAEVRQQGRTTVASAPKR